MRRYCFLSLCALGSATMAGCEDPAPPPITADEEQQLQQDIERAQQAEGAAQSNRTGASRP